MNVFHVRSHLRDVLFLKRIMTSFMNTSPWFWQLARWRLPEGFVVMSMALSERKWGCCFWSWCAVLASCRTLLWDLVCVLWLPSAQCRAVDVKTGFECCLCLMRERSFAIQIRQSRESYLRVPSGASDGPGDVVTFLPWTGSTPRFPHWLVWMETGALICSVGAAGPCSLPDACSELRWSESR